MRDCLSDDMLDDYLLLRLDQCSRELVEQHQLNCARCAARLEEGAALIRILRAFGTSSRKREH